MLNWFKKPNESKASKSKTTPSLTNLQALPPIPSHLAKPSVASKKGVIKKAQKIVKKANNKKVKHPTRKISITIEKDLIDKMDKKRGKLYRSTFIKQAILKKLEAK